MPFDGDSFDAATMALVLFFVPNPARAMEEIVRVVRPGGTAAAYSWDMLGGGFPLEPLIVGLRAADVPIPLPPSTASAERDTQAALWADAGLHDIRTREIRVRRTFADFDEFWEIAKSATYGRIANGLPPDTLERVKARTRAELPNGGEGRITCEAFANAVAGRVPG